MSYKIFDSSGKYMLDWQNSNDINGVEFLIKDDFNLEFRDLSKDKDYYVLFNIKDSYGKEYGTDLVKIN